MSCHPMPSCNCESPGGPKQVFKPLTSRVPLKCDQTGCELRLSRFKWFDHLVHVGFNISFSLCQMDPPSMRCIRLSPVCFFCVVFGAALYYHYNYYYIQPNVSLKIHPVLLRSDLNRTPWNAKVPVSVTPKAQQVLMKTGDHVLNDDVSEPSKNISTTATCEPHLNVAFLKVHKCGSTTVEHMLFNFGDRHNLIVALPSKTDCDIIGHFGIIRDEDYEPPPGGKRWNIFTHHAMYNKTRFHQLMAPNTRYITILRKPIERLQSAFHYFRLRTRFPGMEEETAKGIAHVTTYLKKPSFWDPLFKPPENIIDRENVCFRNCMVRDLGLLQRDYENYTVVQELIKGIDNDFTMVMIMEYLPASLVLLKRRMCWALYDILYNTARIPKQSKYKLQANITQTMEEKFKKHNYADVMLYNHFKELFLKQIEQEGADFSDEVKHFERVNDKVSRFCATNNKMKWKDRKETVIEKSKWNDAFVVDKFFCLRLHFERIHWDYILWSKYKMRPTRKQKRNRIGMYCGSAIERPKLNESIRMVKKYAMVNIKCGRAINNEQNKMKICTMGNR
ncbi:galactosylceramide sulfotransferase-like isoform X2 [Branchiostoma lanceolatum]|uniref:galactosylceramide sulfotransferase-like isoform X2 n=1 Tax=Branchiostoma lanceolatum TaxID=7740 RepID=UPI003456C413